MYNLSIRSPTEPKFDYIKIFPIHTRVKSNPLPPGCGTPGVPADSKHPYFETASPPTTQLLLSWGWGVHQDPTALPPFV